MRMNRKVIAVGVLAAFVVAMIGGSAHDALAGSFYPKRVAATFVRNSAGADNPFATTTPLQSYFVSRSDGNHNAANLGVAVGVEDTTVAIDVRDHWLNAVGALRPAGASVLTGDSTWFCDLLLRSNSSTIDSVTYFRDVSVDGMTWTVLDSLQGHVVSDRLALTLGAVSDSGRVALASFSTPAGAVGTAAGLSFNCVPTAMGRAGITALSIQGVRFIRFRLHMTPGDFAAAGTTRGITAEVVYPASDTDPSHSNTQAVTP